MSEYFIYTIFILSIVSLFRIMFFLVGADIYSIREHIKNRGNGRQRKRPTISIVIPAYNEEKVIIRCIRSILVNKYPKSLTKIYVANNGSTDKTVAKVKKFIGKNKIRNLKLIDCPVKGKARALNYVLNNNVKTDLVMCLDADSYIKEDAIENAIKHFGSDKHLTALAANVRIIDDGSILSLVQQFEFLVSYHLKKSLSVFNLEYIIGGVGSTFRTKQIKKIGFYDTNTLTEDIDLSMKIIRELGNKKYKVKLGSDVLAFTESVMSFNQLIRQRFRWKYGRFQTFYKNREVFFSFNKKYNKLLTTVYLPFILYSEATMLFEPFIVFFVVGMTIWHGDLSTFVNIIAIFTFYLGISIVADEHLSITEKIKFVFLAPIMYILFFIMNTVEYVSLVKSILGFTKLSESIKQEDYGWEHVDRAGAKV